MTADGFSCPAIICRTAVFACFAADVTEQKETQRKLSDSEKQFRTLVENNPLPVWLTDLETGEVYYASPAAAEMLGFSPPEEKPKNSNNHYLNKDDRQTVVDTVKREGEIKNFETVFQRTDGSIFWVSVNSRQIKHNDRDCTITGFVDLTERKLRDETIAQTQEELKESENLFRMLVEHHPLPVALVEVDSGKIIYNSPAAAELTGRSKESDAPQFATQHYADPNDRDKMVAKLREQGYLQNYPTQYKRDDGSSYWISTNSKLIEWHGRDMHIVTMIDLTEQLEREQALAQANETLDDAIESLDEGFALYGDDDRLIKCNSRYKELNEVCRDLLVPGMFYEDFIRAGAERGQYGPDAPIERWVQGKPHCKICS